MKKITFTTAFSKIEKMNELGIPIKTIERRNKGGS